MLHVIFTRATVPGISIFEILLVYHILARLPGLILIAEINPVAESWMIGAPKLVNQTRTRITQIFLLKFDECRCGVVVIPRYLKSEYIGLMLDMSLIP